MVDHSKKSFYLHAFSYVCDYMCLFPNITDTGATNRPQELDEAARRRLTKRLYIPLPTTGPQ